VIDIGFQPVANGMLAGATDMMRRFAILVIMIFVLPGCNPGAPATEGKVSITSTKVFSKNKASKSPAPVIPKN